MAIPVWRKYRQECGNRKGLVPQPPTQTVGVGKEREGKAGCSTNILAVLSPLEKPGA